MKNIKELRLEDEITELIVQTFDGLISDGIPQSDIVDISEALAMHIIDRLKNEA